MWRWARLSANEAWVCGRIKSATTLARTPQSCAVRARVFFVAKVARPWVRYEEAQFLARLATGNPSRHAVRARVPGGQRDGEISLNERADNVADVLLRLTDVQRTYRMGEVSVEVLKHVSLDIRRGEVLAIVGPSGSGKTTILNLVGGMDSPTDGQILFRSQDLSRASAVELTSYRRREIGFVFQFFNLVPNLTARENVHGGC